MARVFKKYISELKSEIEQITGCLEEANIAYDEQYEFAEKCIDELKAAKEKISLLKEVILGFEKQLIETVYDVTDGL